MEINCIVVLYGIMIYIYYLLNTDWMPRCGRGMSRLRLVELKTGEMRLIQSHTISINVNTINTTKLTTNNRTVHQGTDEAICKQNFE